MRAGPAPILVALLSALLSLCAWAAPIAAAETAVPPEQVIMTAAGETLPALLPRSRPVPASIGMGFTSEDPLTHTAPELSRFEFEISRNVVFQTAGLPSCPLRALYYEAGRPCRRSLVGEGLVKSEIPVPGQAPVAVEGNLEAFYASTAGFPRIFARIVTGEPMPLLYVIPLAMKPAVGSVGTRLVATKMQEVKGKRISCVPAGATCTGGSYAYEGIYGRISYFRLFLHRRYRLRRSHRSFVRAGCRAQSPDPFNLELVTLSYSSGAEPRALVRGRCKRPD
jgi:hypothetical protein